MRGNSEGVFYATPYYRISNDDGDLAVSGKGESNSISNQRSLIEDYVKDKPEIILCEERVDDGFSGVDFERPAFKQMMEDVKAGKTNCIIVKDLSRFGRNYIEVGRFIQKIFPYLGVRFIAVNDNYDSAELADGATGGLDVAFKNLIYDYYSREMSKKQRIAWRRMAQQGQYNSNCALYGYRKSEADKHKLVIDEYAAGIVRRIYDMRLAGTAYGQIAAALNREGITSPRVYWSQINGKDGCKAAQLWTYATVKTILHNEVYKGTLVMNHTGTRSYKDHAQISKPETEWIRHEALHEAIVTAEEWEAVQKINEAASLHSVGRQEPTAKLFTGKLVCADCKTPLCANAETQHRKNGTKKRYVSYFCGTYGKSGRSVCSWHRIYEQTLTQIVIAEIRTQAQAVTVNEAAVVDRLKRKIADYDEQRLADAKQEISKLRRRVQELETMTAKLYEDKYSGAVSESTFMVLTQKNEQERLAKAERLDALLSEVDKAQQKTAAIQNWTAIIRKYLNLQDLDRATIDELIDHIEVGERTVVDRQRRQDIKVFYRFVGLVE